MLPSQSLFDCCFKNWLKSCKTYFSSGNSSNYFCFRGETGEPKDLVGESNILLGIECAWLTRSGLLPLLYLHWEADDFVRLVFTCSLKGAALVGLSSSYILMSVLASIWQTPCYISCYDNLGVLCWDSSLEISEIACWDKSDARLDSFLLSISGLIGIRETYLNLLVVFGTSGTV